MSSAAALLQSYPGTMNVDKDLLATAIDEALTCFQTCTACADACLSKVCAQACRACEKACSVLLASIA